MENDYSEKNELQTPCFVFYEDVFVQNLVNFKKALNRRFCNNVIGYSFKTNSLPRLLQLVKENDCYAEVVSDDEYLLAEEMGFRNNCIIFNGPVKGEQIFKKAIVNGSLVNIDSTREIEWLNSMTLEKTVGIGIRVNIDLEKMLPGHTSTGENGGRFGFSYENGELHKAICQLRHQPNIKIDRLHMHISNATKSASVYQCLARAACEIVEVEGLDISFIDFGGGFFGGGDDGAAYNRYVDAIYETLVECGHEKTGVIVEPGASVVATSFSYLTRVTDKKKTTYGHFVLTDGTRMHIDPFFRKQTYSFNRFPHRSGNELLQVICGFTCMENDRIMKISEPEFEIGDMIEYNIVGSYSMCFNSLFISYLPYVYSLGSDNLYRIVRIKWGVKEYIQGNRWLF